MKTHQILFKHFGELTYTPKSPIRPYREGDPADLSAQAQCIFSSDDFRPAHTNLYEVRPVELPDWMEPDAWILDHMAWDRAWNQGVPRTWPAHWQVYLALHCDKLERWALLSLLTVKNFRSDFRRSLKDQVVKWLDTPPEERQYSTPLSYKQWRALTRYAPREARG